MPSLYYKNVSTDGLLFKLLAGIPINLFEDSLATTPATEAVWIDPTKTKYDGYDIAYAAGEDGSPYIYVDSVTINPTVTGVSLLGGDVGPGGSVFFTNTTISTGTWRGAATFDAFSASHMLPAATFDKTNGGFWASDCSTTLILNSGTFTGDSQIFHLSLDGTGVTISGTGCTVLGTVKAFLSTDPGKTNVKTGSDYIFAAVAQTASYPTTATSKAAQLAADYAKQQTLAANKIVGGSSGKWIDASGNQVTVNGSAPGGLGSGGSGIFGAASSPASE